MRIIFILLFTALPLMAQDENIMSFEDYDPPSTLVVPEHNLTRTKF